MALKGNLKDFSVTQLLNLINLARKTGVLMIEGSGDRAMVAFREGKLAYASLGSEDADLASILKRGNRITQNQYRILKQKASSMKDKELGLLLINAGYLTQDDILGSLQHYLAGIIRRLFTWVDGNFMFRSQERPPEDKILVRLDLENLIVEGSRQLREWEQLQEEIPSLDMALKFVERPGANLRNLNLSVEEWRVISYVNPNNSIRQIARAAKMNDVEIRRVVYGLLQAGIVQLVRVGGEPLSLISRMFPTSDREEQKSLVNRLIQRIRSI
jgi:hypothetical protein